MQFGLIAIGAVAGLALAGMSKELLGLVVGSSVLVLFAQNRALQSEIASLRNAISKLTNKSTATTNTEIAPTEPESTHDQRTSLDSLAPVETKPEPSQKPTTAPVTPTPARKPRDPDFVERLFAGAKSWLTSGNVPVKLGVLVSFFGVAFLLKYAVDNQMLSLPIEWRYLGVAAGGCVMLFFGWKLKHQLKIYALSLQGGGIGVLFLTIFAAFRLHFLLPASAAFAMLVVLTVFAGLLAVIQNARGLAILGIVGGFLAPILISTGSANHVGLFTYYLVLNAAVLGIAWFRAWRFLNVLGFVFTFGVGAVWGYQYYQPQMFASTEPFLIVFFLFYVAIAVLFAFRQPPKLRGFVDGTLVFGTPVIAFALQSQLVDDTEYGLAISSILVAGLYAVLVIWLRKSQANKMRLLTQSYTALAVTFATVAIPLALDDRWTGVSWALEGVALVWVGVQQKGLLARLTGVALLFASGVMYLNYGWAPDSSLPVLNGNLLGGLLIALSSLFAAWQLEKDKSPIRFQAEISVIVLLWGITLWFGVGIAEILDIEKSSRSKHFVTSFIAFSAGLIAWLAARLHWLAARRLTLVYLPCLYLIALLYWIDAQHYLFGFGVFAWVFAFAVHGWVLWKYNESQMAALWHFLGVWLLAITLATESFWRASQSNFSDLWSFTFSLLAPIAITTLLMIAKRWFFWPFSQFWNTYLHSAGTLIVALLFCVLLFGMGNPGNPDPIAYVPIFNPLDFLTVLGLLLSGYFLLVAKQTTRVLLGNLQRAAQIFIGVMAFFLTTVMVIRGVHHFGDVLWIPSSLLASTKVQTALSIYWASLGFAGMVLGTRTQKRWIWIAGTVLMGLVVVKLFVVDLGNTATIARIVSFLGVGVLLLVVGYFAPAPPRQIEEQTQAST